MTASPICSSAAPLVDTLEPVGGSAGRGYHDDHHDARDHDNNGHDDHASDRQRRGPRASAVRRFDGLGARGCGGNRRGPPRPRARMHSRSAARRHVSLPGRRSGRRSRRRVEGWVGVDARHRGQPPSCDQRARPSPGHGRFRNHDRRGRNGRRRHRGRLRGGGPFGAGRGVRRRRAGAPALGHRAGSVEPRRHGAGREVRTVAGRRAGF